MRTHAVIASLLLPALATAAPLPTQGDLRAMADAEQWPQLLAASSRVLGLRGPAAAGYDRAAVWTLKAEAQVQADQFDAASVSLTKAAAEPGVSPDAADAAVAHAELFKKAERRGYKTPVRDGESKVFPVKDPKQRPEALAAMLSVNVEALTKTIDDAKAVASPGLLVKLAEASGKLAHLDRVVNKSADASDALQKRLAQNVVASVTLWADKAAAQLAAIDQRAEEEVDQTVPDARGRPVLRKGPRGYLPTDMTEALAASNQALSWADTVKAVGVAMNPAGRGELAAAENVIQGVYDRAKRVQSATVRQAS